MSEVVAAQLRMCLITGEAQGRYLDVECRYDSGDPFEVRLDFGAEEDAVWVLSRDLLAAGLRGPAGEGDIHIEPGVTGEHVFIALSGPDGVALLNAPVRPLARFLRATGRAVPVGAESGLIDWDRCIGALLSGGPAGPRSGRHEGPDRG
ncbi:SsgA family sporulation/cell division regulator [Kitasatospora sp. NPDC057541]|uniref:SsgA family sporulation/cell division regulator n=1 Tax=Kitasatospora sp. NPDC057541 TaxID=3346161 RepID=UPI00368360FB